MSQKITGFSKQFIFPVAIKSGVRIHDNISVVLVVGQKSTFVRFYEQWI